MNINHLPNELHISDRENDLPNVIVNYENQQGEYTRNEWQDDLITEKSDGGHGLSKTEAKAVLESLEQCSNIDFFAKN